MSTNSGERQIPLKDVMEMMEEQKKRLMREFPQKTASSKNDDEKKVGSYVRYENLTSSFADDPIELTGTDLLKKQYKKLCRAMLSTMFDSTVILGEKGCGKSSLIYYFTQELLNENCPESLKGTQVIYFSPIYFPEDTAEIATELLNVLEYLWYNFGYKKAILVFDDFTRYSVNFWREYSSILDHLISENNNYESLKIIVTMSSSDEYVIEEDVKGEVFESSLAYTISQEVMLPKILETLEPKIQNMMALHEVGEVDDDVFELIFGMCLAYTDCNIVSYKRYLCEISKILCWGETKGVSKICFEDAVEFYDGLADESESEMFPHTMDIENIARHEAGHVLLAMLLSEFVYFHGVSIIKFHSSTGEYCDGITLATADPRTWWKNKENYIKYIAFSLAGKYAENSTDAGVEGDLIIANCNAKNFVCTSGCFNSLENNFYCDDDEYEKLSEAKKNAIDDEVKKMLNEANDYARKAVSANKYFIELLTENLVNRKYLTRDDVLEIYKNSNVVTKF